MSSRIIKAGTVKSSDKKIIIERKPLPDHNNQEEDRFTQGIGIDKIDQEEQQSDNIANKVTEPDNQKKTTAIELEARKQAEQLITEAENQAQIYLEQAQQEQDSLLQEIELQAQQTYDEASARGFDEGYAKGEQQGINAGEKQYNDKITEVNNIIKKVQAQKQNEIIGAADLIVELVLEITKKVLNNNPDFLQEQIVNTVTKALEKVRNIEKIDLHINPKDYEKVNEALPSLKLYLSGRADIAIQLEQHIEVGGCVIHTSMGTIDSRISTQLLEIRKTIETLDWGSEIVDET